MIQDYSIFIAGLIAFLGVFIGEFLAYISPEEMKPGKRYFVMFHVFFILAAIILGLVFLKFNVYLFVIGIVIGLILRKPYFYFAGLLFSAGHYYWVFAILIFTIGLFIGTLLRPLVHLEYFLIDIGLYFAVGLTVFFIPYDLNSLFIGGLISLFYLEMKKNWKGFDKWAPRQINSAI